MLRSPLIRPTETEGDWLAWFGHPVRFVVRGSDSADRCTLSQGTVPVGGGPLPHRHTFDEGFSVSRGTVRFTAGRESVTLTEGGFIHIGSMTPHVLKNIGDSEAELIVVTAPAGFDEFQFEGGHAIDASDRSSLNLPPTDRKHLAEISGRYGIDLNLSDAEFDVEPEIHVTHAGEGSLVVIVGDVYRFLATSEHTGGRYAIWEATVSVGGGPPPHTHTREDEGFFVLDGELTFHAEGQSVAAGPGAAANLPPDVPHRFANQSDQPAKTLILISPGGLEAMFERTGKQVNTVPEVIPPTDPEEIKTLLSIAPEYGVRIDVPPHR